MTGFLWRAVKQVAMTTLYLILLSGGLLLLDQGWNHANILLLSVGLLMFGIGLSLAIRYYTDDA